VYYVGDLWVSVGFLTCQNVETASIKVAVTVGINVPSTYGKEIGLPENF